MHIFNSGDFRAWIILTITWLRSNATCNHAMRSVGQQQPLLIIWNELLIVGRCSAARHSSDPNTYYEYSLQPQLDTTGVQDFQVSYSNCAWPWVAEGLLLVP